MLNPPVRLSFQAAPRSFCSFSASSLQRRLRLRQHSALAHVDMCFHTSTTDTGGLSHAINVSKEASEENPTIARGHGTEEVEEEEEEDNVFPADSTTNECTWMSLHSLLEEELESSSFADEERCIRRESNKVRGLSSRVREEDGSVGYGILGEESISLCDISAERESRPVLHDLTGGKDLSNSEPNNSWVADSPSYSQSTTRSSKAQRKDRVVGLLSQYKDPIELLDSMPEWGTIEFWVLVHHLAAEKRFGEALQTFAWWKRQENYSPREKHYATFIQILGSARRSDISQQLFNEMKAVGLQPSLVSYTALLKSYVESGCLDEAKQLTQHMLENNIQPNATTFNCLFLEYRKQGHLDAMNKLFHDIKRWGCPPDYRTYRFMIIAYANAGLFRRMEGVWREMDRNGWKLDFPTINAIIQGYAAHGLINEMHASYLKVKDYRVLVSRVTIRAMASAYIRASKFHQLRLIVKDVDLQRKDMGNFLWNLLLLSFAANFQIKNVQRSCLEMEAAGFTPDITTFNICALGYSRMQMLWELHATLFRMGKVGVGPDMVTFGAVVDVYLCGRVRYEKMFEELDQLGMKGLCPNVETDPLVFEAFGKGDFQSSTETLMQANPKPYGKSWTYGLLLSFYLRRRGARRNSPQMDGSRYVAKKFMF